MPFVRVSFFHYRSLFRSATSIYNSLRKEEISAYFIFLIGFRILQFYAREYGKSN